MKSQELLKTLNKVLEDQNRDFNTNTSSKKVY